MRDRNSWRRWRRVFGRDPRSEVDEELRDHIEQRVRDYVARGMDPQSARRAALERVGDVERVKNECVGLLAAEGRAEERRAFMSVSWLDVKLGVRMLVKYPGLSLVAVIGMAVAIAIGAGSFGVIYAMMDPTLPLDEGDRIVSIQNNTDNPGNPDRQSLHDFVLWRDELESVQDLSAFRMVNRNLVAADGAAELVRIAEVTASSFRVARVPPVLGRPLVDDDERVGATPVVMIAHEEWMRRFDGDPGIVGRPIRLGEAVHTVVGVMPEGFRFPFNHRFWVPLRLNPSDYVRGEGPSIMMFGRLVDGLTLERAQAELTAIGRRMAAAFPDTHEHLRPQILPYTHAFVNIDSPAIAWAFHGLQLGISLLLVVVAVNVAILVYARTATRTGEIALRTALGASRRRVVAQLFVEALVLSVTAAALGLAIAGMALGKTGNYFHTAYGDELPFWLDLSLSPSLVGYVAGLAVLAGVIVGVLPALKATGRRVQAGLQQLSSRGSQMQLGRTWTTLIIVQVAVAVAVLPGAVNNGAQSLRYGTRDPGYPANEFLRAWISMDGYDPADYRTAEAQAAEVEASKRELESRFAERSAELIRRLEAEPDVPGVTFASSFPGEEQGGWIEVESIETPRADTSEYTVRQGSVRHLVRVNHVDVGLFDVFAVPVLAGKGFVDADTRDGSTAVIVNRTFAERIAGGGNVLGRRVRHVDTNGDATPTGVEEDPWFEIVGVVPDFPTPAGFDPPDPRLYHPATPGQARLAVRLSGGSTPGFAGRLRDITAAVDPALKLEGLESVAVARRSAQQFARVWGLAIGIATLSVLLLSAAGIYAMMSFTVARRRREIGIRTALGADARRVLSAIVARASVQLGTGIVAGLIMAVALDRATGGEIMGGRAAILLPTVSVLMLAVGLLAVLGPARRGLSVQPTEALREE